MKYYLIGYDEKEYGPYNTDTLEKWAEEGRLNANSILIDEDGKRFSAQDILIEYFKTKTPYYDFGSISYIKLPNDLQGLNWGGFFLPISWGLTHKSGYAYAFLALLLIGMFSGEITTMMSTLTAGIILRTVISLVYLFKGNEIAWKHRFFQSKEHFKSIQRIWAVWGIVLFVVAAICLTIMFVFFTSITNTLIFNNHMPLPPNGIINI